MILKVSLKLKNTHKHPSIADKPLLFIKRDNLLILDSYLDEYRTSCGSPQAELALSILEAMPVLTA